MNFKTTKCSSIKKLERENPTYSHFHKDVGIRVNKTGKGYKIK